VDFPISVATDTLLLPFDALNKAEIKKEATEKEQKKPTDPVAE